MIWIRQFQLKIVASTYFFYSWSNQHIDTWLSFAYLFLGCLWLINFELWVAYALRHWARVESTFKFFLFIFLMEPRSEIRVIFFNFRPLKPQLVNIPGNRLAWNIKLLRQRCCVHFRRRNVILEPLICVLKERILWNMLIHWWLFVHEDHWTLLVQELDEGVSCQSCDVMILRFTWNLKGHPHIIFQLESRFFQNFLWRMRARERS